MGCSPSVASQPKGDEPVSKPLPPVCELSIPSVEIEDDGPGTRSYGVREIFSGRL